MIYQKKKRCFCLLCLAFALFVAGAVFTVFAVTKGNMLPALFCGVVSLAGLYAMPVFFLRFRTLARYARVYKMVKDEGVFSAAVLSHRLCLPQKEVRALLKTMTENGFLPAFTLSAEGVVPNDTPADGNT